MRRYAIRVLTKLIQTHPYAMYGGLLDLDEWKERYSDLQRQLDVSNFLIAKSTSPCGSCTKPPFYHVGNQGASGITGSRGG